MGPHSPLHEINNFLEQLIDLRETHTPVYYTTKAMIKATDEAQMKRYIQ